MLKRLCFVAIDRHGLKVEKLPLELREEYLFFTTASVSTAMRICSPWSAMGEMLLLVAYYFGRGVEFRRAVQFIMQRQRCDDALETVEQLSGCRRLTVIESCSDLDADLQRFERNEILTLPVLAFQPRHVCRILAVPGAVHVWPSLFPVSYLGHSPEVNTLLEIVFRNDIDILSQLSPMRLLQILFDRDIRKRACDQERIVTTVWKLDPLAWRELGIQFRERCRRVNYQHGLELCDRLDTLSA